MNWEDALDRFMYLLLAIFTLIFVAGAAALVVMLWKTAL